MQTTEIYGIHCTYPDAPSIRLIDGSDTSTKKQKFKRTEILDSFYELDIDEEGNAQYTEEQINFIKREFERCRDGYWFMNNGGATYITGDHYFYLNYWTLESGIQPEFRDADRKWFLFYQEISTDPSILGVIRVKKRREGATSQSSCILTKEASSTGNTRCGIISKTGGDASDLFMNMVVYGFRAMPIFLQPRTESTEDPKKRLVLVKQSSKKKKSLGSLYNKREGLNSFIEWRNTALNSFDSGRWSKLLIDEASKFPKEVDIVEYWNIVKKTLTEGANKVGFALMVSTVNPPNNGGQQFKLLWDDSNQFKHGRVTPSKLVRYFAPASEGLAGFIDTYGMSRKEEAQEFILANYRNNDQDTRDYPLNEEEAFKFNQADCHFNLDNILEQEQNLRDKPVYLRKGRFYLTGEDKVEWSDDSNGNWLVYRFPEKKNNFQVRNNVVYPGNVAEYGMGVDPYRSSMTSGEGSKGSAWICEKVDPTKENTGALVAHYYGRPKLQKLFWKEMLMASMYYGVPCTMETDAGDSYYEYFKSDNELGKNCLPMLGKKPDAIVDPTRKTKVNHMIRGVASADAYALSKQLEYGINYVEHYYHLINYPDLLDELKRYQHDNRTKYDRTVSFLITLLTLTGQTKAQQELKKRIPMIETYSVNRFD